GNVPPLARSMRANSSGKSVRAVRASGTHSNSCRGSAPAEFDAAANVANTCRTRSRVASACMRLSTLVVWALAQIIAAATTIAATSAVTARSAVEVQFGNALLVLQHAVNRFRREALTAIQRHQLDQKRQRMNLPAQPRDEVGRRARGSTGRQEIVH